MMSEWDVIAFGYMNDETSLCQRVTAATYDEALTVFDGLFAVAFPVKHSVLEQTSCAPRVSDNSSETSRR